MAQIKPLQLIRRLLCGSFLLLYVLAGNAQSASPDLLRLRELRKEAEAAAAVSASRSAQFASQAITLALSLKESGKTDLDMRAVSQEEIRSYVILGDAFRSQQNDRKATRYYRQGLTLAQAIEDREQESIAEARLRALGKDTEDPDTRFSRFGRQVLSELEGLVKDETVGEEIKTTTEEATLSVIEWQGRQAQRRGDYAKAIKFFQQTLPYYLSAGDTTTYRSTCIEISQLYARLGNKSESENYRALGLEARDKKLPAQTTPAPNAIEDLRDIVEESEAQDRVMAEEEARTQQERRSYLDQAEALLRSGNVEESIESLRKATELQDRLARLQRQRQLDSAASAHFIENQLQEIELLTQQQELQAERMESTTRTRNFLLLAFVLILAIAGLITYLFFAKKRSHRVLSQTFEELNHAHEELKHTQTKLVEAEKMASLGQLTAGIAHEINNPVNFISGNLHPLREDLKDLLEVLELYESTIRVHGLEEAFRSALAKRNELRLDEVRDEIHELIEGIEEGAQRTTEIVQGLRIFARMDGGEPQGFLVSQGLDSTLALLKNQLEGIEVIRDYGDVPEIEGFPGKLNQVFMNLFTNAIQAMNGKGWLRIKTGLKSNESIFISIQDTGSGISQEIRQRIFDPFFTTKAVGKGTGLGLSISLGIVQQHGGNIDIQSQVNQGTEVIVTLPLRQPMAKALVSQPLHQN